MTIEDTALSKTPSAEYRQDRIDAVRAQVNERTRDLIDLALLTGARPGELVAITGAMLDRIHRIRQLAKAIELIDARQVQNSNDKDLRAIIEDLIRYEMDGLRALCEDSQPYAAQSRQLVKEFLNSPSGSPAWLSSR